MVRDEGWLGYRRKWLDFYGTLRHDVSTSHDSSIGERLAAAHRGGLYPPAARYGTSDPRVVTRRRPHRRAYIP